MSPIPIFEKHWLSSPVLPVNLTAAAVLILNTQCRVPTSGELLSLALVLLVAGLSGSGLAEATKGSGQLGPGQKQNLDTIKQRTAQRIQAHISKMHRTARACAVVYPGVVAVEVEGMVQDLRVAMGKIIPADGLRE
ncbi:MAG: hypothetical protein P8047_17190 [Gammaproteobacteria bacterium]